MSQVWFLLLLLLLCISPSGLRILHMKAETPHRLSNDTTWMLHVRDFDAFARVSGDGFKPFQDDNDAFAICISVASLFIKWNYSACISHSKQDKRFKKHLLQMSNALLTLHGNFNSLKRTIHGHLPDILNDSLSNIYKNVKVSYKRNESSKNEDIYNNKNIQASSYAWVFEFKKRCELSPFVVAPLHTVDSYVRDVLDDATLIERMRYEWARYETFKSFPIYAPVMPSRLSKNGFFYTGVGDEVQCYSCTIKYKKWADGDIVSDVHKQISPSCRHMNGIDRTNVPIYCDENEQTIKQDAMNTYKDDLASTDSHSPIVNEAHMHPEYEEISRRKESFSFWSDAEFHDINQIAESGFYYSETGRCLRCFSCGAGVANIDMSLIVNAHVLSCHFVQSKTVQSDHEPMKESKRTATDSANRESKKHSILIYNERDYSQHYDTFDNEPDEITEENSQGKDKECRISLLQQLIEMGFEEDEIQRTISSFRVSDVLNVETIVEVMLNMSEENKAENRVKTNHRKDQKIDTLPKKERKPKCLSDSGRVPLNEENGRLKELLRCKVCMDGDSTIVILPCGHLCTCPTCTVKCRKCPMCRKIIRQTIRVTR